MKRILLPLLCAAALVVGLAACDPQEVSKDAIRQHFPAAQHNKAIAVAQCESGLNPGAVSPGGGNWGLFQVNTVHRPMVERMGYRWEQMKDAYVNARVARVIYDDSLQRTGNGWRPWSCA